MPALSRQRRPALLREIAGTADPDQTLTNLEKVTASLGAKAVLWELFSFSPPSLRLYVDLCAGSQFLADILVNNPGMSDELLDSLVLNRPRTIGELRTELAALCRHAADATPILHSFQDKELLRIGVADLLGKTPEAATAAALSDLAETVLAQIADLEMSAVTAKFGAPRLANGAPCRWAILALGKLGGRELSYHSDLDLVLVYEGEGPEEVARPESAKGVAHGPPNQTDNRQFFSELARRVIRSIAGFGPMGRLYAVDMRLRPTGGSGSLAVPLAEFERYYAGGGAQIWERQALTKARALVGEPSFCRSVESAARRAAFEQACPPTLAEEIRAMRERREADHPRDLKRGAGGLVDVDFVVQLLQLRHAAGRPELQAPNTRDALAALHAAGLLTDSEHADFRAGYDFLRLAENRLRGVTNRASDELPDDPAGLARLARRLGYESAEPFLAELSGHTRRVRAAFERLCGREAAELSGGRLARTGRGGYNTFGPIPPPAGSTAMSHLSRRRFLQSAAAIALAKPLAALPAAEIPPSERLRVAMIGTGNQAEADLHNIAAGGAEIAVLCDVDERMAAKARSAFPKADFVTDFRRIMDRKDIDAVAVATPDHTHAIATLLALQAGKHVFCEKPLTHNVVEARKVAEAAKRHNRVTQMGIQIHALDNYRRVVELIRAGAIGPVREVFLWVGNCWDGEQKPKPGETTPAGLHFDLWLGPAADRPYSAAYLPRKWRGWWDFGGGTLADMGCHYYDLAQWALGLTAPSRVTAEGPPVDAHNGPAWLTVRYDYAATSARPALSVIWNSSRKPKEHAALLAKQRWGDGALFIGDKGMLLAGYTNHKLLPEDKFHGFEPPPQTIPKSIGHYKEWVEACKGNGTTTCPFSYAGPLSETVLLGNVAYRAGTPIEWHAAAMKIRNAPAAERFLRREYRGDWGRVVEGA